MATHNSGIWNLAKLGTMWEASLAFGVNFMKVSWGRNHRWWCSDTNLEQLTEFASSKGLWRHQRQRRRLCRRRRRQDEGTDTLRSTQWNFQGRQLRRSNFQQKAFWVLAQILANCCPDAVAQCVKHLQSRSSWLGLRLKTLFVDGSSIWALETLIHWCSESFRGY